MRRLLPKPFSRTLRSGLRRARAAVVGATSLAAVLSSAPLLASDDLAGMASELARLRAEVEELTRKIDDRREEDARQSRALGSQRSSLEAELEREQLRIKQFEAARARQRARVDAAGSFEAALRPAMAESITAVENTVGDGLPFQVDERLADLARLREEFLSGTIAPSNAVSRLWSRIEDELRLGRENGLHNQVVSLADQEVLAEVARLGMVMLYFQTPDGRTGSALRSSASPSGWRYQVHSDADSRQQIQALFDSLRRRARAGFFELPNPMAKEAR